MEDVTRYINTLYPTLESLDNLPVYLARIRTQLAHDDRELLAMFTKCVKQHPVVAEDIHNIRHSVDSIRDKIHTLASDTQETMALMSNLEQHIRPLVKAREKIMSLLNCLMDLESIHRYVASMEQLTMYFRNAGTMEQYVLALSDLFDKYDAHQEMPVLLRLGIRAQRIIDKWSSKNWNYLQLIRTELDSWFHHVLEDEETWTALYFVPQSDVPRAVLASAGDLVFLLKRCLHKTATAKVRLLTTTVQFLVCTRLATYEAELDNAALVDSVLRDSTKMFIKQQLKPLL